jgi:hypothetical protein
MKYLCFGYLDVKNWETKSEGERNEMIDACLAYDDVLKKNGSWAGGEGIQGPDSARTLRYQNGKVSVTDGPYAETKELLGGFLIIEARDISHSADFEPSRRENGILGNPPGSRSDADDSRKRKAPNRALKDHGEFFISEQTVKA